MRLRLGVVGGRGAEGTGVMARVFVRAGAIVVPLLVHPDRAAEAAAHAPPGVRVEARGHVQAGLLYVGAE